MKKTALLSVFLIIISLISVQTSLAYDGGCSAASAILYQPDTDTVLFEKEPDRKSLVASTTKILTALVVLENCSPEEMVEIKAEYTGVEGSSIYLKAGQRFTVKELLLGLMLASGNDAAHALACHTAGSDGAFADLMNGKAKEIGCTDSHFVNPHGLDAKDHYSTARDLAKIMAEAMKNPVFAEITGTKSVDIGGRNLTNHNRLLWSCNGVIGGKTGYTESAGRTLVSVCERENMRLICVTISDRNDWEDHSALYNWAYGEYWLLKATDEFTVPVISGVADRVSVDMDMETRLVKKSENCTVEIKLPPFVYAPVKYGDAAGVAVISADAGVTRVPMYYSESVPLDDSVPLSIWEQIKWSWYYYNKHSSYVPRLPAM